GGDGGGDRAGQFAALPFPLMAPRVPGYKIADVFPVDNSLVAEMVPTRARRDQWGAYEWDGHMGIAITVTVAPASTRDPDIQALLASCHLLPPPRLLMPGEIQPCRADGGVWIVGKPGSEEVIRRQGGPVVVPSASVAHL